VRKRRLCDDRHGDTIAYTAKARGNPNLLQNTNCDMGSGTCSLAPAP